MTTGRNAPHIVSTQVTRDTSTGHSSPTAASTPTGKTPQENKTPSTRPQRLGRGDIFVPKTLKAPITGGGDEGRPLQHNPAFAGKRRNNAPTWGHPRIRGEE